MAGAQQQQNEPDNSLTPLWISLGLMVAFGILWFYFKSQIIAFILAIRSFEIDLINIFVPKGWSHHLTAVQNYIHMINIKGNKDASVDDLLRVSDAVGSYLKYPTVILLGSMAVLAFLGHVTYRYRKTHSMVTLSAEEVQNWPQILPVMKLDLLKEDIDKGPWAMAQIPLEFSKRNNLLIIEAQPPSGTTLRSRSKAIVSINRDEARKIFAMQLGFYWSSPEALPIHARALFATFAARINGDREGAVKLLTQISTSAGEGNLNFSGTDELLNKHKKTKLITTITKKHSFVLTVMASMLEVAREDGVFASADFLWLKPRDRKLWFMLNCVGRQTPFSEVAGPFAHWIAEKEIGRRLNVPMVEEAVTGLITAMKEIVYIPDEDTEAEETEE